MCDRFSFVVTADGKYFHNPSNSHTGIRSEFDISEVGLDDQQSWELEDFPKEKGRAFEYVDFYQRGLKPLTPAAKRTARRVYQAIEDLFIKGDTSCFRKDGLFGDKYRYQDLIHAAAAHLGRSKVSRYFTYGPKVLYPSGINLYLGDIVQLNTDDPQYGTPHGVSLDAMGTIVSDDGDGDVHVDFPNYKEGFYRAKELKVVKRFIRKDRPQPKEK